MTVHLSAAEARRVALAAQGFADPAPRGAAGRRALERVFDRVGLIQIDSVNVLVRSHYLPPFARLGGYDPAVLEGAAWGPKRGLFEYWGHEASLIPVALQPLFRWRMARAERGEGIYGGLRRFAETHRPFIDAVEREVAERGPLAAGELAQGGKSRGAWWGWSDGKRALEWLFWAGRVTTAARRGFERLYDLTERALPAEIVAAPTPPEDEALRRLVEIAARSMGVATETDLRDYFRLGVEDARRATAELIEAGALLPARVEGWDKPAVLHPAAEMPARVRRSALLSPFDSLVWRRERTERLFGFRYRLEIYTPADKRDFGYYVLPWLHGEAIPARVDLKADRRAGVLRVKSAHAEPGTEIARIAAPLARDLRAMADWLRLAEVSVEGREPLAAALRET